MRRKFRLNILMFFCLPLLLSACTQRASAVAVRFGGPSISAGAPFAGSPILTETPLGCTDVDFRSEIPVNRYQGETNFCFAYATAVIVSQRTGVDVAALDIANTFFFASIQALEASTDPAIVDFIKQNPRWRDDVASVRAESDIDEYTTPDGRKVTRPYFPYLAGGNEDVAALLTNATGLCAEADFPSDKGLVSHQLIVNDFLRVADSAKADRSFPEMVEVYPKFRDPVADIFNSLWLNYINDRCHRVKPKEPLLPIRYYSALSFPDYLQKKAAGRIDLKKEAGELFKVINYAIDHHRTPAVGYSLFSFAPRTPDDPDPFADHSSAIVARKSNGNQCYYLLRDNSGVECDEYGDAFKSRCSKEETWVTKEELMDSLYSVVYLK